MGAEPALLGIDLGTSSVKATLIDHAGVIAATSTSPYRLEAGYSLASEIECSTWWSTVADAVRTVVRGRKHDVAGIGLSGQMHGVVLLDPILNPIRPAITWFDDRAGYLVPRFESLTVAGRWNQPVNPAISGMAALSLMWLAEHEPWCIERSIAAVQPKDWLGTRLTGAVCSDASDASGTLLWDFGNNCWDDKLIESLGLPRRLFPPIRRADAFRGELLPRSADELGLDAGIPISVGLADTAAALLGNECIGQRRAQLTIGSGAQICETLSELRVDPRRITHTFCGPLLNQWYIAAAIASAGLALDWARRLFGLSWSELYDDAFAEPATEAPPIFHPYVAGERTPFMDDRLRADWIGLNVRHGRPQLLRAALEGTAFAIRDAWDAFRALTDDEPVLCLAGGGSHDPRWRQMLANALETPLHLGEGAGGSSRGAALTAGCAIGWFDALSQTPRTTSWLATVEPNEDSAQIAASRARFLATHGSQRLPRKTQPQR